MSITRGCSGKRETRGEYETEWKEKENMKKIIKAGLCVAAAAVIVTGCGNKSQNTESSSASEEQAAAATVETETKSEEELAKWYDAFVITDEVYEYIIYDGNRHISMAALPGMYERTITCSSLSKTYSMTGWRLGYLIGPERVIEAAKKVHDFLTVGAAAPLQEAAVTGLKFGPEYYEWLKDLYTEKRDYLCGRLEQMGLPHTTPQGSYFVLVDISGFLERPEFSGWTDLEFCEWMIKKYGVAAVPGSSFFKEPVNNYIRLHFSRGRETLKMAADRLEKMAKDYGFC